MEFISITQPILSHGTPFRHAMIAIFSEMAQIEREVIVERVRSGLLAAKKRGVKLGRPPKERNKKMERRIIALRNSGCTYKEIHKRVGTPVNTIARICQRHIKNNAELTSINKKRFHAANRKDWNECIGRQG